MAPQDTADTDHVVITHVFDAPIEDVFRAWTDADELAAWYGPAGMHTPRANITIDLRVGGRVELIMVSLDGEREFAIGYEIVEMRRPELLVLRSDPMPHAPPGASPTVRVELEDLGAQTRMTLTDGPLSFGADHAEAGYLAAIEKLTAHLGAQSPSPATSGDQAA